MNMFIKLTEYSFSFHSPDYVDYADNESATSFESDDGASERYIPFMLYQFHTRYIIDSLKIICLIMSKATWKMFVT